MAVVGAPGPESGVVALMAPLSSMLAPPAARLLGNRAGMVSVAELPVAAPAVVAPPVVWDEPGLAGPAVRATPPPRVPGRPLTGASMSGVTGVGDVVPLVVVVVERLALWANEAGLLWA